MSRKIEIQVEEGSVAAAIKNGTLVSHEESASDEGTRDGKKPLHLPLEVVILILKDLNPGINFERHILQNLALISRVWCRAAQARLFRSLGIVNRELCQFYSRKFRRSPHLGEYVRRLCLSDPDDDCLGTPYLRTSTAKALVSTLTRLQEVFLHNIVRWGPVEQRLVKGFQSITTLSIGHIIGRMKRYRDIPDLFHALPGVETLRLLLLASDDADFPSKYEAGGILRKQIPENGERRQLRELQVVGAERCMEYFMWLTGPSFDLSRLTKLTLGWLEIPSLNDLPVLDLSPHDEFFRISGRYITVLELTIPCPGPKSDLEHIVACNPRDYLTEHLIRSRVLGNFTALETISLHADEYESSLPFLLTKTVSLLEALITPYPSLRKIKLTAGLDVAINHDPFRGAWLASHWKAFDELLARDTFSALSAVDLALCVAGCNQHVHWDDRCLVTLTEEKTFETIEACLPQIVSKGLLNVTPWEEEEDEEE